jgi:hypothetical protein
MGAHVFVSYARSDETYVGRLAAYLRVRGVKVWTDAAVYFGAEWPEAIQDKIDSCAAFVVVMSPAARQSAWVRREVLHARTQQKPIFPLMLSGAPLFALNDLQFENVEGGGMPSPRWIDHLRATTSPADETSYQQSPVGHPASHDAGGSSPERRDSRRS